MEFESVDTHSHTCWSMTLIGGCCVGVLSMDPMRCMDERLSSNGCVPYETASDCLSMMYPATKPEVNASASGRKSMI